jgi:hypothetical protein
VLETQLLVSFLVLRIYLRRGLFSWRWWENFEDVLIFSRKLNYRSLICTVLKSLELKIHFLRKEKWKPVIPDWRNWAVTTPWRMKLSQPVLWRPCKVQGFRKLITLNLNVSLFIHSIHTMFKANDYTVNVLKLWELKHKFIRCTRIVRFVMNGNSY